MCIRAKKGSQFCPNSEAQEKRFLSHKICRKMLASSRNFLAKHFLLPNLCVKKRNNHCSVCDCVYAFDLSINICF